MAATAKRAPRTPTAPARIHPEPVFGKYRCYWINGFGRPCNKLLGVGAGQFEGVCPRCHNRLAFQKPNDIGG